MADRISLQAERVLIATDGSAAAHEVEGVGLDVAIERGASVTFVHVFPPGRAYGGPVFEDARLDEALAMARLHARMRGVEADTELRFGRVSLEIIALSDTIEADTVVVSARLLGPLSRALLRAAARAGLAGRKPRVLLVDPAASAPLVA